MEILPAKLAMNWTAGAQFVDTEITRNFWSSEKRFSFEATIIRSAVDERVVFKWDGHEYWRGLFFSRRASVPAQTTNQLRREFYEQKSTLRFEWMQFFLLTGRFFRLIRAIFVTFGCCCTLFDSSLKALQLWFWVFEDWTESLDANWRKCAKGVSVSWLYLVLLRPFADERFILSTCIQKTFDKAFKELSNGIR